MSLVYHPLNEIPPEYTLYSSNATAYCLQGTTASGEPVREGICACRPDWIGKYLAVYQKLPDGSVGDLIGIYECLDTGGTAVANGYIVDVWQPDMTRCQEFMNKVYEDGCRGRVYIQVFEGDFLTDVVEEPESISMNDIIYCDVTKENEIR